MPSLDIEKDELRQIVKEAVASVLVDNRDILEDVVSEAILDLKLVQAIEKGDTGNYVSEEEIMHKLDS
ncbi:MAG: hypothetical protein ACP5FP_11190 [Desulfuromonadaceae bacterium]